MSETLTFSIQPLQAAVQDYLELHPYLADIPVLTEAKGDIENEIKRALGELEGQNGKSGACIVILTPSANIQHPNAPGPILDPLNIVISVIENVMVNHDEIMGTKKHAVSIAEFILRYLHHWTIPGTNAALCAKSPALNIVSADPLTYHVNFQTRLALQPEPAPPPEP